MNKQEKLLNKALTNPYNLSFEEFRTLLKRCDYKHKRTNGSHEIWEAPSGQILSIQNNKGKAKGYQVKQFIVQYEYEQEVCYENVP